MVNLRKEAQGRECMVRIPGVCNHNPETTVLAHINLPGIGGMGMKAPDLLATWACSACHDVIDGRVPVPQIDHWADGLQVWAYEGVMRTQYQLWKEDKVSW